VISGYFKKKDEENPVLPENIDQQIIARTLLGLNTIEETGKGLSDFVNRYRSLTSLPQPDLREFSVSDLFRKCKLLMESGITNNIKINAGVYPENIVLTADYSQVEQVLINLVKNAIDAVSDRKNGVIQLNAFHNEDCTIIQVEDNGTGISADSIDDIFVPFYTTKENGSGIGLSLSRQIMRNHNGTISVSSALDKGTVFTLKF
jgi:two-component system nitrogen regulation sensor histidine kinase NtrY